MNTVTKCSSNDQKSSSLSPFNQIFWSKYMNVDIKTMKNGSSMCSVTLNSPESSAQPIKIEIKPVESMKQENEATIYLKLADKRFKLSFKDFMKDSARFDRINALMIFEFLSTMKKKFGEENFAIYIQKGKKNRTIKSESEIFLENTLRLIQDEPVKAITGNTAERIIQLNDGDNYTAPAAAPGDRNDNEDGHEYDLEPESDSDREGEHEEADNEEENVHENDNGNNQDNVLNTGAGQDIQSQNEDLYEYFNLFEAPKDEDLYEFYNLFASNEYELSSEDDTEDEEVVSLNSAGETDAEINSESGKAVDESELEDVSNETINTADISKEATDLNDISEISDSDESDDTDTSSDSDNSEETVERKPIKVENINPSKFDNSSITKENPIDVQLQSPKRHGTDLKMENTGNSTVSSNWGYVTGGTILAISLVAVCIVGYFGYQNYQTGQAAASVDL